MVPVPASTGPPGYDVGKDMAKMDPSAADMALAVWNGYMQDARRHAHQ
jgi:hypothetical protein